MTPNSGQIRYHFIMQLSDFRHTILSRLTEAVGSADEARAMERILLEELLLMTPAQALARPEYEVPDFIQVKYARIIALLRDGRPLQYILGRARFFGMSLRVSPAVLIPRPETEQLVDMIIDRYGGRADLRVLDLGTGSGCIALALARNLKFAEVTGVDVSDAALEIARKNAGEQGLKVNFIKGDILNLNAIAEPWDVIVSNPPYVLESEAAEMERHVLDHEPHGALFVADGDPMRFYRPTIDYWRTHRAPGGMLFFEINPHFAGLFTGGEIERDFYGKERFALYA